MIVARLESVSKREPSRRDGLILTPGLIIVTDRSTPIGPNHTVPTGRFPFCPGYQALKCLATIIQSLRDEARQRS